MVRCNVLYKAVATVALSFGLGIFLAIFLPAHILVIIEAALIAATGFFYLFKT